MSTNGSWSIRGYRPGRMGGGEPDEDQSELVRLANVKLYAARAKAGLPIFEDSDDGPVAVATGKPALRMD